MAPDNNPPSNNDNEGKEPEKSFIHHDPAKLEKMAAEETPATQPEASNMSWPAPVNGEKPHAAVISPQFTPTAPVESAPQPAYNPAPSQPNNYGQQPPAFTPAANAPAVAQAPLKEGVNTGLLVLQWLTYAFWGWTILGLSILTGLVVANFVNGAETGGAMPYGIAAVLVLLPISFVCDHFYSKIEPDKKTGAASILMVIHAVLFALFGIGSVIGAVIALVMLFTNGGSDTSAIQTSLYTALIIAIYYGMTFLRTLNLQITPWVQKYYKFVMIISVGIIALLGIIGPLARERAGRDDRLISSNLSTVTTAINTYTGTNKKLPGSLKDLTLRNDAKVIVDRNLVEYKPGTLSTETNSNNYGQSSTYYTSTLTYKYEVCVTYKHESPNYGRYNSYDTYSTDDYSYSPQTYSHPAGRICYKLKTSYY